MAALVLDMFWPFNFVKNHKIANNPTIMNDREKISAYLESLEFQQNFEFSLNLKIIKFYYIKVAADF